MKRSCLFTGLCLLILLSNCSSDKEVITVKFDSNRFEKRWAISQLGRNLPADWSQHSFLSFDMRSSSTQWFDLKIYDSTGIRRLSVHPMQGPWVRVSVPLVHFRKRNTKGMDLAAIGKTARPGYWIGFTSEVGEIRKVDSLGVAMRMPVDTPILELKNFALTEIAQDTIYGPVPLIDQFGQWIPDEWPGKVRTIDDLRKSWQEEDSLLVPGSFRVSRYGGFLDRKVKASGFFRVEKIDGIWWFVDPEGYLFYSTGSTGIGVRSDFARIRGREYIFSRLPVADDIPVTDPFRKMTPAQAERAKAGPNYSFFSDNIYMRFGDGWHAKWMEFTYRRMDNWGLNTIANWSDVSLGGGRRKAHVVTLRGWGIESGIMGMPDIYDPSYEAMVGKAADQQCSPRKNDPFVLGYFLGNEPAWPHREQELVNEILAGDETPMRSELKKFLEKGDTPERRKEFVYLTYEKFVNIVSRAIEKYDPNHLNLGLRFGGSAPDEIIKASAVFDVFSFNSYGYVPSPGIIKRVTELTGQPMIIGEFHFGVPGRGLAPGLAQTVNQEERAVAYQYYVENAASYPSIIGTHWFQWIDQPATGRFDGENYNIGFVDVTDRPYPEMVKKTKEIFSRLYAIHSGKEPPVTRQARRQ